MPAGWEDQNQTRPRFVPVRSEERETHNPLKRYQEARHFDTVCMAVMRAPRREEDFCRKTVLCRIIHRGGIRVCGGGRGWAVHSDDMGKSSRAQSASAATGVPEAAAAAQQAAATPLDDLDKILEVLATLTPKLQTVAAALRSHDSNQKAALDEKDKRIAQLEELVQEANARDQRSRVIHEEFEQRLSDEQRRWTERHAALAADLSKGTRTAGSIGPVIGGGLGSAGGGGAGQKQGSREPSPSRRMSNKAQRPDKAEPEISTLLPIKSAVAVSPKLAGAGAAVAANTPQTVGKTAPSLLASLDALAPAPAAAVPRPAARGASASPPAKASPSSVAGGGSAMSRDTLLAAGATPRGTPRAPSPHQQRSLPFAAKQPGESRTPRGAGSPPPPASKSAPLDAAPSALSLLMTSPPETPGRGRPSPPGANSARGAAGKHGSS